MIGIINGIVEFKEPPFVIIDVNGVGYRVIVPGPVSENITRIGERIKLFTHTHVREDLLELYGFPSHEDLKIFENLISVSGIGCRTAMGVFSVGSRNEIIHAITTNNIDFFMSVPRLGKKNAQKIIIELSNKLGGDEDLDLTADGKVNDEAVEALKSFGFSANEARNALKTLKGKGETSADKIRLALKYLGK